MGISAVTSQEMAVVNKEFLPFTSIIAGRGGLAAPIKGVGGSSTSYGRPDSESTCCGIKRDLVMLLGFPQ